MKQVVFNTGNDTKYLNGLQVCANYGIDIVQNTHEVDEIQSEDPKKVALDKAQRAYAVIKKPTVITDDSWSFLGLNGFPGVYMHSMNHWLSPEDLLRLVSPLKNRKTVLTQYLVFVDDKEQKVFKQETEGIIVKKSRGTSPYSNHTIIALSGDNGLTIAEVYNKDIDRGIREQVKIWHEFSKWYTETH